MPSPYDSHPGFYQDDNRKDREISPVTKEQLENKHAAMFSEWNIKGKTVLDLGSAMGATGQWVLFHEAKKYVGVEAQESYVEKSRDLLAHHGSKAEVIHDSMENFLENNKQKFDVVVMLGVIYAFIDQYKLLKQVTSICNEVLIIEGMYPQPHIGNPKYPFVEISDGHTMVLADGKQSLKGIGAKITPTALGFLLNTLGFESIGKLNKPKQIKAVIDNYNADPKKYYYARYICSFKNTGKIQNDLTNLLNENDLVGAHKEDWRLDEDKRHFVDPNLPTLAEKQWEFDGDVAEKFEDEARKNIPDYDRVIDKCIQLANKLYDKDSKIIDVGSALGETLKKFHQAGYSNLFGVDSSTHMLEKAFQTPENKLTYIHSEKFPKNLAPFSMITANWVLHFIKERKLYLKDIYESLQLGGSLILSDKVALSETVDSLYKDFKLSQGLSEEYIAYKEEALKEILVPYPLEWYLITLREVGFRSVEIINANYAFVTFFVVK